jgi:hypothetical protein
MGGEELLEPNIHETNDLGTINPDSVGQDTCRDMRSIEDRIYSAEPEDESQTKEDADEGWVSQNQSPIAGHITGTMEELEEIQSSEVVTSNEVLECIKDSLDCYQSCTETAVKCLTMGGMHAEKEHLNLLMDCAKICNTNADFMLRNSTYSPQTCGITADICDECADTCDRFEEDFMKDCAHVCRRCSESCREMTK